MKHRSIASQTVVLLAFIATCAVVAGLGSVFTMSAMDGWYQDLEQPSWNPPDAVFGPVWSVLYLAMAVAAWLVWRRVGWTASRTALLLFALQLVLNLLWTAIFFGLEMPGAGAIEIVVLWLAIAATIAAFWRVHHWAAILMAPYLGWVTYATALTISIWAMN